MRYILIIAFIFTIITPAFATDFRYINNKSIDSFIRLWNEQKEILQNFSDKYFGVSSPEVYSAKQMYSQDLENLYVKYNITADEFMQFTERVKIALAYYILIKNQKSPEAPVPGTDRRKEVSGKELKIIEDYENTLNEIFSVKSSKKY